MPLSAAAQEAMAKAKARAAKVGLTSAPESTPPRTGINSLDSQDTIPATPRALEQALQETRELLEKRKAEENVEDEGRNKFQRSGTVTSEKLFEEGAVYENYWDEQKAENVSWSHSNHGGSWGWGWRRRYNWSWDWDWDWAQNWESQQQLQRPSTLEQLTGETREVDSDKGEEAAKRQKTKHESALGSKGEKVEEKKTSEPSGQKEGDQIEEKKAPEASGQKEGDKVEEKKTSEASGQKEGHKVEEKKASEASEQKEGDKVEEKKASEASGQKEGDKVEEKKTSEASGQKEGDKVEERKASEASEQKEGDKVEEKKASEASEQKEGEKAEEKKTSEASGQKEGDKVEEKKASQLSGQEEADQIEEKKTSEASGRKEGDKVEEKKTSETSGQKEGDKVQEKKASEPSGQKEGDKVKEKKTSEASGQKEGDKVDTKDRKAGQEAKDNKEKKGDNQPADTPQKSEEQLRKEKEEAEKLEKKKKAHAMYMKFFRSVTSNVGTPEEVRRIGKKAVGCNSLMSTLYESWTQCGGDWKKSSIYLNATCKDTNKRRGERRWMIWKDIVEKFGFQGATDLVEYKKSKKDLAKNEIRKHPDAPDSEELTQYLLLDADIEVDEHEETVKRMFQALECESESDSSESSSVANSDSSDSSEKQKKEKKKGFKEVKEAEERGEKASQEIKKNKGSRPKNKKNDKKPKKAKKEDDDDEEQKEVAHKKEVLKEGKKAINLAGRKIKDSNTALANCAHLSEKLRAAVVGDIEEAVKSMQTHREELQQALDKDKVSDIEDATQNVNETIKSYDDAAKPAKKNPKGK